jgi:hypothetical protein
MSQNSIVEKHQKIVERLVADIGPVEELITIPMLSLGEEAVDIFNNSEDHDKVEAVIVNEAIRLMRMTGKPVTEEEEGQARAFYKDLISLVLF